MDDTLRAAIEGDLGTAIVVARPVHGGDVAIAGSSRDVATAYLVADWKLTLTS